jgi:hypothetical protein
MISEKQLKVPEISHHFELKAFSFYVYFMEKIYQLKQILYTFSCLKYSHIIVIFFFD